MTDLLKIKQLAAKIFPRNITGTMNLLAFPSPTEVWISDKYPDKKECTEVLIPFSHGDKPLSSNTIVHNGEPYTFGVYAGNLKTPDNCVVCNRKSTGMEVLEVLGPIKLTYPRITISGADAGRVWRSIQADRFWFTLPVCNDHKDDFNQQVSFDPITKLDMLEIKFPNRYWTRDFLKLNSFTEAIFKSETYLRRLRWSWFLIFIGFLGSALALSMGFGKGEWWFTFLTIPLLVGGFISLFNNRFEVITLDNAIDDENSEKKLVFNQKIATRRSLGNILLYIGIFFIVLGILTFLEVNGEAIQIPWYVKVGCFVFGAAFLYLRSRVILKFVNKK